MTAIRRLYTPQPPAEFRLTRGGFAALAVLYALIVAYSSLLLGPDGLHYVPISAAEAWQKFSGVRFIDNGSDQRADWIANMMMTIPLAYLVNGAFAPQVRWVRNATLTLVLCIAYVVLVKYAQLFFPPRTVTLNYIAAQSIGALLGVGAFHFAHSYVHRRLRAIYQRGDGLVVVLGGYSLLLTAYFLMPFDLALSPDDLLNRLTTLQISVFPGAGRDTAYRALLVMADLAATFPAGMFLAVTGRHISFHGLMARGIAVIIPVAVLSLFVLSVMPFAFSLVSRTVGVALGIWFMWSLRGKDLWKRHYRYAQYVPVAFPIYVTLLALAYGLLTEQWVSLDRIGATLESRELLPLWTLYIDTKAEAARHVVVTFAMFAPVGTMIWLRRGFWSKGAGLSAVLAFLLSAAFEFGRLMKPGLTPDVTNPFIAAFAAAVTFRAMPELWKLFEQEAKSSVQLSSNAVDVMRAGGVFGGIEVQPQTRPASTLRDR
jgi:VanZ family protein